MRFTTKSILSGFLVLTSAALFAQSTPNKMKVTEYTLKNGLKVMLTENHEQPKVFGMVAVNAGGKNDPHDATGIAHYLEHVLFKGTQDLGTISYKDEKPYLDSINYLYEQLGLFSEIEQRDSIQLEINKVSQKAGEYAIANELDKVLKGMGATGVNAFTSEDFTAYHNTFPANQMEKWLELYSHRFEDPVFRLFQSELETVYEEKNISMDGGFGKLFEAINANMYKNHPYGTQTILGSVEHLKNPSLKKMYEFFNTYYVANNMVLALSGDFDTETIIPLIEDKFGKWKSGEIPEFPDYPEKEFEGRELVEVKLTPIKIGILGYRTPKTSNKDEFAFEIVNEFLSNQEGTGYLDKLSNDGKLMASMVMAMPYNDYGSTMVLYAPKVVGQNFEKAEALVMEQIEVLKSGAFTDAYFNAIILNKKKEIALQEEDNFSRVYYMVSAYMQGQTWKEYKTKFNILESITRDDIIKLANKYYGDNYLSLQSSMGFPKKEKITKPDFEPVVPKNEGPSAYAKELNEMPTSKVTPRFVDFKKDITTVKETNGMTLVSTKNPFNEVFDLSVEFHAGLKTFPNLEYLTYYLDFIGTDSLSSADLKEKFHELGASYYFEADENAFTLHIQGMDQNLEAILRLTNNFFVHAKADESKVKKLREDLEGEKKIDRDEPSYISSSLAKHVLYGPNAPLQRELTKKELKNLTGTDLLTTFKSVITYQSTVNYTGNENLEKVGAMAKKFMTFSANPEKAQPFYVKEFVPTTGNKIYIINRKKSVQSQITFSVVGSPRDNSSTPQIAAFNNYFGGDMSSIVFQEIREFRSLAYSAYGYYGMAPIPGKPNRFKGFIGCQSDKTNEAIEVMDSLIQFMPEKPERMESIVSSLTEKSQSARPNFRDVLNTYDTWIRAGYKEDPNQSKLKAYPSLTFTDIVNFHNTEIKGKPMVITIVGDMSKFDIDRLKKIGEVIIIKEKELYVN